MTVIDPYKQARALYPTLDNLEKRIEAGGERLGFLRASASGPQHQDPESARIAESRRAAELDALQSEIAGLKNELHTTIGQLEGFAVQLDQLSSQFRSAAEEYRRAASGDARHVSEAAREMAAGADTGLRSSDERRRQADEVRRRISRARGVLNAGPEPQPIRGSGTIDVVIEALSASYGRSPSSIDYAAHWTTYSYGSQTMAGYSPGSYTLSTKYEPARSYYRHTGGMDWS